MNEVKRMALVIPKRIPKYAGSEFDKTGVVSRLWGGRFIRYLGGKAKYVVVKPASYGVRDKEFHSKLPTYRKYYPDGTKIFRLR